MALKKINYLLSFSLLFVLVVGCDHKDEYETSMFMRNNTHTSVYQSTPVTKSPKTLWKVKTEGHITSSPVIANQTIFIGSSDHKMYAIDAQSGEINWTFSTNGAINSTPLVTEGKVLFLSYDGYFYALNQLDGEVIWKFKTQGEELFKVKDYFNGEFKSDFWDFYLSSAIVKDNVVYFGSSDHNVYALDLNTGAKLWSYETKGSIHSSPAIYENYLVVGSWDSNIYCIDIETGLQKWVYPTGKDTEYYVWIGVQGSPSIDNGIAYVGSRDAKVYAIDIKTGDSLWVKGAFKTSWMPSSAAIYQDNVYIGSSDIHHLYAINKNDGNINFEANTKAYTFSSPAIDGTMAYVGSGNGRLFGIELKSGKVNWEYKTQGVMKDTIGYFNSEGENDNERIIQLAANIKDMDSLSLFYTDVFSSIGSILSSPIIDNQVIYFGSYDGTIYAITDKD